ncbi:MAG: NAD(+)/NADH kinase [Candidatus Nanoarchaeia archaeon]
MNKLKIKNVLLATKQTSLEYYRQKYDSLEDTLSEEQLIKKKKEHEEHYNSFSFIKRVLEKRHIAYQRVYMPYGSFEEFVGRDLIISVGGDGTVLNTARYILDSTPLLTVKSEKDSVGALCKINADKFEEVLEKMIRSEFEIDYWTRVEGKFGNKKDIALNEISIGPKYFSGTARYKINFKEHEEEQRSSKIIINTGAGSTGWYNNIANSQGPFNPHTLELRYIVSESTRNKNYQLTQDIIKPKEIIEITSLMDINGCISFDGDTQKRLYDFPMGTKLHAQISDKPLSVINIK